MPAKPALVRPGGDAAVKRGRSAHDVVVLGVGLAIVKGDYAIGSLLPPKDELMARFGVSQTTLREALQTLTAKGMIAARAKVGTRVRDETQWNMFDGDILAWRLEIGVPASFLGRLFEIRQTLEPVAAAFAALRRRPRDVVHLRQLAQGLTFASDDTAAFVRADVLFHEYVLEVSGNPFMHSLGALIGTALSASFTLSAPTEHPELSAAVRRQHLDIVDAIEARDAQRASDAMVAVIRQGWTNYTRSRVVEVARLGIMAFQPE